MLNAANAIIISIVGVRIEIIIARATAIEVETRISGRLACIFEGPRLQMLLRIPDKKQVRTSFAMIPMTMMVVPVVVDFPLLDAEPAKLHQHIGWKSCTAPLGRARHFDQEC